MNIILRDVKRADWDFILELRNDFYSNFYQQNKPLSKMEHYEYLEKQKSNPQFHHWIVEYQNEMVGYVRIHGQDVGIMVKKEYQNKGIASESLKQLEKKAHQLGIPKLIAMVKVENESSKTIFLKNNYKLKMYWLEKQIS